MQRILITGASSGIGRALAVEMSREGGRLALAARRKAELEETAAACRKAGAAEVAILPADLALPSEAQRVVAESEKLMGGLDVVIANAGVSRNAKAEQVTWEDCRRIFDVNVNGTLALILAALPGMVARKGGQVVAVSSIAGFRGLPTAAAYCASKAALTTFLEPMRVELKPRGVHVTIVSPGFIATPLTEKNRFPMPFLMSPEKAARVIARGIRRRKRHVAFPWPMVLAMKTLQALPTAVYDRLMTLAK